MSNFSKPERRRLDSIGTLWFKGQPFKKTDIVETGKYPCLHYGELFSKYGAIIDIVSSHCDVSPKRLSQKGDILFPASDVTPAGLTRCSAIMQDNVILGGDVIGFRPQTGLNPIYLSYAIRHQKAQLLQRVTGALIKHISAKSLQSVIIPIHSIESQNRFEKQVRHLNRIISYRRTQLTKLNELIKCRFVELFGDPIQNKQIYKLHSFTEFAYIDAEMTTDYHKYANYPHIGIDSIEKETGRLIGYRTVAQDGVISGKYLFSPEHLIYSKIRPNLNKVACPDFHGVCSADSYPIRNKSNCNKYYLLYVLRSQWFLDYIVPLSSRTNLPKVNRKQIESFTWPLPPIELQNQFEAFVRRIDKLRVAVQASLDKTQQLFDSLMQEYFG